MLLGTSEALDAPQQTAMSGAAAASEVEDSAKNDIRIETMTRDRFVELLPCVQDGFGDKRCCCCLAEGENEVRNTLKQAYADSESSYYYPDSKVAGCAIAIRGSDNKILGFIQTQKYKECGDASFQPCFPCFMHEVKHQGEIYVEKIALCKESRGQGVGTRLLKWVEQHARDNHCTEITLDVIYGNPAIRLYEREGYVIQKQQCCNALTSVCMGRILMGARGIHTMRKPLN
eukprot:TRINITY_DN956_c1_g3_i1.p1 TRINITY_DN956_c1_g3~~TRINITY_DN956_c1_g3_i1.p1  ORF type:complete len:231 (-),score=26.88 TRINITY_DN956_c1_g3_i1:154-846(-)